MMAGEASSKPVGTRERIATGALALFNVRGIGRVTTAEIAAAAGIREGNLHYHFARKGQLVEALFAEFEVAALDIAGVPLERADHVSTYFAYQRRWFELMWAYRCFYRDGSDMLELAPALRDRVQQLRRETQARARNVFVQAIEQGLMRITPDGLTRLMDNIWIVSSYWMTYRSPGPDLTPADLEWGFAQVQSLVAPYLVPPKGRG